MKDPTRQWIQECIGLKKSRGDVYKEHKPLDEYL